MMKLKEFIDLSSQSTDIDFNHYRSILKILKLLMKLKKLLVDLNQLLLMFLKFEKY